jgi:3-hydroxybutyryl-CoA dehydratase
MSPLPAAVRGMYFEEFEEGQTILSTGRTVTETDIVNFAGLSADYNEIHINAVFSEATPIGKRIAHGVLGLSIASGLAVLTGVLEGTIIVFREINAWKFVKPIFIGDTVHVVMKVLETKAMPRVGGGQVLLELDLKNQEDVTTQKGTWKVLVMSKPEENE